MEAYTQRAVTSNKALHVNHVTSKPDRLILQLFEVLSALTHVLDIEQKYRCVGYMSQ